jgi:2-amino-4-hydroxy-6-hydroxymethyldihydropteridine diphosphokinase
MTTVTLIGMGSNLAAPSCGGPVAVLEAALAAVAGTIAELSARSRWYWSAPVPPSAQPLFVNGVCAIEGEVHSPPRLLAALHAIEARFGRVRSHANAARVLDLDLLACGGRILRLADGLVLPHPRLHRRAFVLRPLADVAPGWRHPVLGLPVETLLAACADQWLAAVPWDPRKA